LIALVVIALLSLLLFVPFWVETAFKLLLKLQVAWVVDLALYSRTLWTLLSSLTPSLLLFLLFFGLFWFVPTKQVEKSAAFWGGLSTTLAWKVATYLFNVYLHSGLSRYDIVYGSLGTVVALNLLIYILSWITLFGAHLCASLDHWLSKTSTK
jgi:membrane protein